MRISSIIPISEVNGPGPHYTIWVQGCTLKCPGCFNPQTHDQNTGREVKISHLLEDIKQYYQKKQIIGVTLSGGEPFQQLAELIELIALIKQHTKLGIIILTGYTLKELKNFQDLDSVVQNVDLIIAGRFNQNLKLQSGLRGSSNKNYWFTSNFYKKMDLDCIPLLEVITNHAGEMIISGIEPEGLFDLLKVKLGSH